MKRVIMVWLIGGLFVLFMVSSANASGMARPLGIGGAFIGVADDVNAVFYNSAGISFLEKKEFEASAGTTSFDVFTGSVGYRQSIDEESAFGLALSKVKSEVSDLLCGSISYSRKFIDFLSFGVDIKREATKITDPVEKTGQSTGLDVCFLYRAVPEFSIGIKISDLLSTDITYDDETSTPVSSTLNGGIAGTLLEDRMLWAVDLSRGGSMTEYKAGIEGRVLDWLMLRGGISGSTSGNSRTFMFGAGFDIASIVIDIVHQTAEGWNAQEVSLGVVF